MNLVDLVDENGLQQDEWSLTTPVFGKEAQLKVVGWNGKSGGKKYYILKCNKCSEDPELFGEGYFRNGKSSLVSGSVSCGCAFNPKWSSSQYTTLCSRKAKELGYTFLGFHLEWKGAFTKIKMHCDKHGEWTSGTVCKLITGGRGCRGCMAEGTGKRALKPDDIMIQSFFKSNAFHPDTKFWRSERKTKMGWRSYWYMFCPECGEQGESFVGDLQLGCRPCDCSKQRQKEAYINWIIDNNNIIAVKFGIARDSEHRVKKQDRLSVFEVRQHLVYAFPSVAACKKAERLCKQGLETGIISKEELPDGYSETTHVYNLDKIRKIYEEYGGVEECHSP